MNPPPSPSKFKLPSNIEAEAAILGAILIENRVFDQLRDVVDEADFFEPVHARIFSRIAALRAQGATVTPITLKPFFEGDEALEQLGGIKYLARLSGDSQGLLAPLEIGQQLRELAERRQLIALGRDLAESALDTSGAPATSPDDLVENACREIETLKERSGKKLPIEFAPYAWPAPAEIPRYDWLLDHWVLRGAVTMVAAPGGAGKTSLIAALCLSLSSGKPLLRKPVYAGPQRVQFWNFEDDYDQLSRQLAAASLAHGVSEEDCGERLFVSSGLGGGGFPSMPLNTATQDGGSFRLLEAQFEAVEAAIRARQIDVLVLDPFISTHHAQENQTEAMDRIAKRWSLVAHRCSCAILLVHHTRKTNGEKADIDAVRGSIAGVNAARIVLLLNRMTESEGAAFGLDDADRRRIFSVDLGKANRSPPESIEWFQMDSVELGNGGEGQGDEVGAAVPWLPPDMITEFTLAQLEMARAAVANGNGRASPASPNWVGHLLAEPLEIRSKGEPGKSQLKLIIRTWLGEGKLKRARRHDPTQRKEFEFIELGNSAWSDEVER